MSEIKVCFHCKEDSMDGSLCFHEFSPGMHVCEVCWDEHESYITAKHEIESVTALTCEIAEFRSHISAAAENFDQIMRFRKAGVKLPFDAHDLRTSVIQICSRLIKVSNVMEENDFQIAINHFQQELKKFFFLTYRANGGKDAKING